MKLRRSIKPLGSPFDLTPLVNVVLLLLVFFLLGSTFVIQPGIKVNPPAGLFKGGLSDVRYVINITAQDPPLVFFNNQLVSAEQLGAELQQLAAKQPKATVVVRADGGVPHGMVTQVMNQAFAARLEVLNATQ
jgi:biopolymer transport protein ExbD